MFCKPRLVAIAFSAILAAVNILPKPTHALADPSRVGPGCNVSSARAVSLPTVVSVPNDYTANRPDPVTTQMKAWADYIMRLSSRAAVSSSERSRFKSALVSAAQANALQFPKGWDRGEHRPPSTVYHTMESLFPAVVGYARYKSSFDPAEQRLVENWIKGIVDRLGRTKQIRKWKLDNKKYQYGALMAAFGYVSRDGKYLNKAESIYKTAIKGMRSDGSLPGDSGRGGSALHYTNLSLANLTAIAEFAALSGRNIYDYESRGKSLHLGVQFLAQATNNPELIAGYANTRDWQSSSFAGYSPTKQDRRWASGPASLWGYTYLARYARTGPGQALRRVSSFISAGKAGVHQQSGGNARCFAG